MSLEVRVLRCVYGGVSVEARAWKSVCGGRPRQQHLHVSFGGVGGARDGELRQGALGHGRLVHDEHLTTQEEPWRVRGHPEA